MTHPPLVSIIIVNYNGKRFLHECLTSIFSLQMPRDHYEVLLVDNYSWDDSVVFTKTNFPQVRIISNTKNLGFSAGNNVGAKHAKGKYLAFLNNDTKVDPLWLPMMVKRIEQSKNIAAVNAKTLLRYPFLELHIQSAVRPKSEYSRSASTSSLGVIVESVELHHHTLQHLVQFRRGFDEQEKERWTTGDGVVVLPYYPGEQTLRCTLTLRLPKGRFPYTTPVSFMIGDRSIANSRLACDEVKQWTLTIHAKDVQQYAQFCVQNAGNVVFKDSFGRDYGAVVKETTQFYEFDGPFFQKPREILAFCGVGVLMRKEIFDGLGGFDESYFMYYEDTDLSLTMRRCGYTLWYEPKAVIYHMHAGSSGEGSMFFTFHVERGHLLFLLKHFPLTVVGIQMGLYIFSFCIAVLKMLKWGFRGDWLLYESWSEKAEYRGKILWWVTTHVLSLVWKRMRLSMTQKKTLGEIFQTLY